MAVMMPTAPVFSIGMLAVATLLGVCFFVYHAYNAFRRGKKQDLDLLEKEVTSAAPVAPKFFCELSFSHRHKYSEYA